MKHIKSDLDILSLRIQSSRSLLHIFLDGAGAGAGSRLRHGKEGHDSAGQLRIPTILKYEGNK